MHLRIRHQKIPHIKHLWVLFQLPTSEHNIRSEKSVSKHRKRNENWDWAEIYVL